jgi:hypothetical protein
MKDKTFNAKNAKNNAKDAKKTFNGFPLRSLRFFAASALKVPSTRRDTRCSA